MKKKDMKNNSMIKQNFTMPFGDKENSRQIVKDFIAKSRCPSKDSYSSQATLTGTIAFETIHFDSSSAYEDSSETDSSSDIEESSKRSRRMNLSRRSNPSRNQSPYLSKKHNINLLKTDKKNPHISIKDCENSPAKTSMSHKRNIFSLGKNNINQIIKRRLSKSKELQYEQISNKLDTLRSQEKSLHSPTNKKNHTKQNYSLSLNPSAHKNMHKTTSSVLGANLFNNFLKPNSYEKIPGNSRQNYESKSPNFLAKPENNQAPRRLSIATLVKSKMAFKKTLKKKKTPGVERWKLFKTIFKFSKIDKLTDEEFKEICNILGKKCRDLTPGNHFGYDALTKNDARKYTV